MTNQYRPDYVTPPGDTLLETLQTIGMSQAEFAERMGRPKKTINEIIKGKASITPETALQMERVLGISAGFWNNRERIYREHVTAQQETECLETKTPWLRQFPLREMIAFKWIRKFSDTAQQAQELLNFFGVASPDDWASFWDKRKLAYRKSQAFSPNSGALAAWIRKGELRAQEIECAPFEKNKFEEALVKARNLSDLQDGFDEKLTDYCREAGVAVTFVQELRGTCTSGVTRWLSPHKALIALSLRYKRNDQIMFSFFHEAGHVLLHEKSKIFLDGNSRTDGTDEEHEADRFASNHLIPLEEYEAFVAAGTFSEASVVRFARQVSIHPGIVVGRLQHDHHIPYTNLNRLKISIRWA